MKTIVHSWESENINRVKYEFIELEKKYTRFPIYQGIYIKEFISESIDNA